MMPPFFDKSIDSAQGSALIAVPTSNSTSLTNTAPASTTGMDMNMNGVALRYYQGPMNGKIDLHIQPVMAWSTPALNWNAMQGVAAPTTTTRTSTTCHSALAMGNQPKPRHVRFLSLSCQNDDNDTQLTTNAQQPPLAKPFCHQQQAPPPPQQRHDHVELYDSSSPTHQHRQTPQELEQVKNRVKARADMLRQRRERHHKKRCIQRFLSAASMEEEGDQDDVTIVDCKPASSTTPCMEEQVAEPVDESDDDEEEENDCADQLQQMRQQIQALACEELEMLNRCKALRDKRAKIAKNYKRLVKAKKRQRPSTTTTIEEQASFGESQSFVLPPTFPN
mmetsp:Transcript_11975/g.29080  ORF Transcript_11975/g.29080 Transcript_11975/m.29080 type:complete len:335 (-) Transcript_11975:70-1074(-)